MLKSKQRPFLAVFFLLVIGILLENVCSYVKWIIPLFLVGLILWLYLEYKNKPTAPKLFYVLILISGYLLAVWGSGYSFVSQKPLDLTGQVISQRSLTHYQRIIVKSPEIQGKLALHYSLDDLQVTTGMWVRFTGCIKKPDKARNPGEFCYLTYLKGENVYGVVEPDLIEVIAKQNWLANTIVHMQNFVKMNLQRSMQEPSITAALVLGQRNEMPSELLQQWQQLGITHLLAVSGMHIGLLACIFTTAVRKIAIRQWIKHSIVLSLLLCYVFLTGGSPSSWRAWLASLFGLTSISYRPADGIHIWSFVGTIMVLISPQLVWQIGFQLSFLASGSIILWAPVINKLCVKIPLTWYGRPIRFFASAVGISLVAQISLAPLLVYHFGQISLLAPIASVVILPMVFILLIGGLILGFLGPMASPIAKMLDGITQLICFIGHKTATLAFVVDSAVLPYDLVVGWYIVFIALGIIGRKSHLFIGKPSYVRWIIYVSCIVLVFSMPLSMRYPLEITFLDVGQGDAIYICTPFNQHILIDGGGDSVYWQVRGRNVGLYTVIPYLKYRGVKQLDLVVLSHPHEDHIHGLLAVFQEIPVKMVIDNGQPHTTESYIRYLELIEQHDIAYKQARAGDRLILKGGIVIDVLHPDRLLRGTVSDLNNNSLVINVSYQGRNILLTGDIDTEGQNDLLRRDLSRADLVKVPHHGSKTALLPLFYQKIQPLFAVICVGNNSFGHPHDHVIATLSELGVKSISRTDEDGAVSFFIWNGLMGRYSKPR